MAYPTPKQVTHKAITPIRPSIVNIRIALLSQYFRSRTDYVKEGHSPSVRGPTATVLGSTNVNYNIAEQVISRPIWSASGQNLQLLGNGYKVIL